MYSLQRMIDKIALVISGTLLGIMMIILAYNVVARFIGGGIPWYMESTQYLNVWAMFIAGIGICVSSEHLRISMIEDVLPGKMKLIQKILVGIVTIAFYVLLAYGTYLLAIKSKQQISTMRPLKMAYVYWPLPIASGMSAVSTCIALIIDCMHLSKKGGTTDDSVSVD